jgi:hypothetical protein
MSEIKTGGPAYPVSIPGCGDNGMSGMTLRDWFAGQAIVAVTDALPHGANLSLSELASNSYAIADAMLAAREGEPK